MGRCTATNKATGRKCKYQALPGKRKCGHHTKSKGKGTVSMLHSEKTREEILGMVMTKAASASKDKLLKVLEVLNASSAGPSRVIKRNFPSAGGEKTPRKKPSPNPTWNQMTEQQRQTIGKLMRRGTGGPNNWTDKEKEGILEKGQRYLPFQRPLGMNEARQYPPGHSKFFDNKEVIEVIERSVPETGGEKKRQKVVIPVDSDSEDEGSASRPNPTWNQMTEQQRQTIGKLMRPGTGYQEVWSRKEKDGKLEDDWSYAGGRVRGLYQPRQYPPGHPDFFLNAEVKKFL